MFCTSCTCVWQETMGSSESPNGSHSAHGWFNDLRGAESRGYRSVRTRLPIWRCPPVTIEIGLIEQVLLKGHSNRREGVCSDGLGLWALGCLSSATWAAKFGPTANHHSHEAEKAPEISHETAMQTLFLSKISSGTSFACVESQESILMS